MKRKLKKKQVHDAYVVISGSRIVNLKKNEDKVEVLKVLRELRRVATSYEEDAKETSEKLKPENYDEQQSLAAMYEAELKGNNRPTSMSEADYNTFIALHLQYSRLVANAMKDVDEEIVELEFEPIDDAVLDQLMNANGWTVEQFFRIEEIVGNRSE